MPNYRKARQDSKTQIKLYSLCTYVLSLQFSYIAQFISQFESLFALNESLNRKSYASCLLNKPSGNADTIAELYRWFCY